MIFFVILWTLRLKYITIKGKPIFSKTSTFLEDVLVWDMLGPTAMILIKPFFMLFLFKFVCKIKQNRRFYTGMVFFLRGVFTFVLLLVYLVFLYEEIQPEI